MFDVAISPTALETLQIAPTGYPRLFAEQIGHLQYSARPANSHPMLVDGMFYLKVSVYRILYSVDQTSKRIVVFGIKHQRRDY